MTVRCVTCSRTVCVCDSEVSVLLVVGVCVTVSVCDSVCV